jgi:hypothetical protein
MLNEHFDVRFRAPVGVIVVPAELTLMAVVLVTVARVLVEGGLTPVEEGSELDMGVTVTVIATMAWLGHPLLSAEAKVGDEAAVDEL